MRHLVLGDEVVDPLGAHLAQADMGAGSQRHCPRKTPPVAMEHGQRPEIDRVMAHRPGENVANRKQMCPTVMVNHALGIPSGAGGEVERDGVPFVSRTTSPGESWIATRGGPNT